jgi:hypothetical protein
VKECAEAAEGAMQRHVNDARREWSQSLKKALDEVDEKVQRAVEMTVASSDANKRRLNGGQ